MKTDLVRLHGFLVQHFNFEELYTVCFDLDVDLDDLRGESVAAKARELIVYLERRDRLEELVEIIRQARPLPYEEEKPNLIVETSSIGEVRLNLELASLRQQLVELERESLTSEFNSRMSEILKTANRAVGQSQGLVPRIILPQQEDVDIRLVPSHLFERLEEYRTDENIAYLLIGLFGGAILGILCNWVTDENFVITYFSIVLVFIFAVLTIAFLLWARRIRRRASIVKEKMLRHDISPAP